MIVSPRKKPTTPVKVHLMHQKSVDPGENGASTPGAIEEKREEGISNTNKKSGPSRTRRTPVKEALQMAVVLSNQGKFLDAIKQLDRAVEIYPELSSNVRLHLNRGSYHFKASMYEEALADFDRAAQIDDGVASLHYNRANVLKVLGRDDEALKCFQRAAEIDPKLADAHAGVAQMLARQKRYRHAWAAASRALELDPNHFSALDAKVKALAKLGRTLEAVDSVRALVRLYQQMANVSSDDLSAVPEQHRRAFARILDHAAEKLPASENLGLELAREAFSLDGGFDSCYELGNQLFIRGLHAEAATVFKRCGELEPNRSEAGLLEGACLIQTGNFERALAPLRRALKSTEGQKETRYYLGLALFNLGRFSEAIPQLRRVVEADIDDSDEILERARYLLASAYVHAGDEHRAFKLLQAARHSKRASADAEVHYQAGYAATLIGLWDDAKDAFEDCLKIDPDHARAAEGLRNILDREKTLTSPRPPSPPPMPPPPESGSANCQTPSPLPPLQSPPNPPTPVSPLYRSVKLGTSAIPKTPSSPPSVSSDSKDSTAKQVVLNDDHRAENSVKRPAASNATTSKNGPEPANAPAKKVDREEGLSGRNANNGSENTSVQKGTSTWEARPKSTYRGNDGAARAVSSYRKLQQLGIVSGAAAALQAKTGNSPPHSNSNGENLEEKKNEPKEDITGKRQRANSNQPAESREASQAEVPKLVMSPTVPKSTAQNDMRPPVPLRPPILKRPSSQTVDAVTTVKSSQLDGNTLGKPNPWANSTASASGTVLIPSTTTVQHAKDKTESILRVSSTAPFPEGSASNNKRESPLDNSSASSDQLVAAMRDNNEGASNISSAPSHLPSFGSRDKSESKLTKVLHQPGLVSKEKSESHLAKNVSVAPPVRQDASLNSTNQIKLTKNSPQNDSADEGIPSLGSSPHQQKRPGLNSVGIRDVSANAAAHVHDTEKLGRKNLPPPVPAKRPQLKVLLKTSLHIAKLAENSRESNDRRQSESEDADLNNQQEGFLKVENNTDIEKGPVDAKVTDQTERQMLSSKAAGSLSKDVQIMIKDLFGPPEGSIEDVEMVEAIFLEEGVQRMADIDLLSVSDIESMKGMKRAWCRRIINYINTRKQVRVAAPEERSGLPGPSPSPVQVDMASREEAEQNSQQGLVRSEMRSLLSGIQAFPRENLKPVEKHPILTDAQKPDGMEEVMKKIKEFQRHSLKRVDTAESQRKLSGIPLPSNDATGLLGTFLNAMRSRRVLIEDLNFDNPRRDAAASDADKDDMFEADWT